MQSKTALLILAIGFVLLICAYTGAEAQQASNKQQAPQQSQAVHESATDGVFMLTLKSPDRQTMTVDELVRDRDLNPKFLYRVKTGGYIGFDESEWVEKIEFKVFERPVTELPEYKRFSTLLVEINAKIWRIKRTLEKYDLLALRLMNICDRSKFSSLQAIDDNILKQLSVYRKLLLLRSLVLNSLSRFQRDRACTDLYADYQRTLNIYSRQLMDLSQNYRRLSRKALSLAEYVKPAAEKAAEKMQTKP